LILYLGTSSIKRWNEESMIEKEKIVYGRKIDWSGIMAGTVVSFSLLFLFYLLGVGVGILENQSWSESPFLTGSDGRVWGWISFGVSILLGGIVAARFSGVSSVFAGGMQGLLSWSLLLIVSVFWSPFFIRYSDPATEILQGLSDYPENSSSDIEPDGDPDINRIFRTMKNDLYHLMEIPPVSTKQYSAIRDTETVDPMAEKNLSNMFPGQMYSGYNTGLYLEEMEIGEDQGKGSSSRNLGSTADIRTELAEHTDLSEEEIDRMMRLWWLVYSENLNQVEQMYIEREQYKKGKNHHRNRRSAAGRNGMLILLLIGSGAVLGFVGGLIGTPSPKVRTIVKRE